MAEENPIIRFEHVTYYSRDEKYGVYDFSLTISPGSLVMVLGPEGSGKSLLLSLILAKALPKKGKLYFRGQDISLFNERQLEIMRSQIGVVSHNYGLINNLSVLDNIALPLRYHARTAEHELTEKIMRYLSKFAMEEKAQVRPQVLSESEKLRVAFLRALLLEPAIILMEEALEGKCPLATSKFMELALEELNRHSITLLATGYHPLPMLPENTKFLLMYEGRPVFLGNKHEFFESPNPYVVQYLKNPLHGPMKSFFKT
ncbi:MAG: ATP-binding cassette domain-containing protein [Leptospiraceae bacterium]|nr:ATP-binding cassette domain-containing protein [Leptospiraceae bacterium]MDW8307162.1 ATP-binding cassette domain-containing protein [Leptospiraceae bacterium]